MSGREVVRVFVAKGTLPTGSAALPDRGHPDTPFSVWCLAALRAIMQVISTTQGRPTLRIILGMRTIRQIADNDRSGGYNGITQS